MAPIQDDESGLASDDSDTSGDPGVSADPGTTSRTDDGASPGFDEAALYGVVRSAVEDAILGVIGTLLLTGVAFVLVGFGISLVAGASEMAGVTFGGVAIVVGLYVAAATLRVIPPIREWF